MKLKHLLLILLIPAAATVAFWYFTKPAKVDKPVAVDHSKQEIKSLRDEMAQKDSLLFNMAGQIAELRDSVEKLKNVKPITKIVKKNEKVIPISDASSKLYTSILSKRYSKGK
jgi:Tfp pilus assembly protein PilO